MKRQVRTKCLNFGIPQQNKRSELSYPSPPSAPFQKFKRCRFKVFNGSVYPISVGDMSRSISFSNGREVRKFDGKIEMLTQLSAENCQRHQSGNFMVRQELSAEDAEFISATYPAVERWFELITQSRNIGSMYSSDMDNQFLVDVPTSKSFDAQLLVERTTAARKNGTGYRSHHRRRCCRHAATAEESDIEYTKLSATRVYL